MTIKLGVMSLVLGVGPLRLLFNGQIKEILFLILAFVLAISVHESAHAWMAYKLGDTTARDLGRISLDPLRHLDPLGSLLLLFVGLGYAKPVPFNPSNFKPGISTKKGALLVAIAGPISNGLLASLAYIVRFFMAILLSQTLLTGVGHNEASLYMTILIDCLMFLDLFVVLNIGLAAFNLLPIPPLDGSKILPYIYPFSLRQQIIIQKYSMFVLLGLIYLLPGFFDALINIIKVPINWLFISPLEFILVNIYNFF